MAFALGAGALSAALLALQAAPPEAAARHRPEGSHYVDGTGARWEWRENRHGAVLRNGRSRLYLGRDCDARSARWGRGRWGWANGGILVTFPRHRIGFPRQDPPVEPLRCFL